MSVDIFGSSGSKSSSIDKNYVDQKFKTLSNNLATKINKSGDNMTGDLNMGNNIITSTVLPHADEVLTNKIYVDSKFNTVSNLVNDNEKSKLNKAGDVMTGALNMNGQHIIGLENPTSDDEACNKKYVDLKLETESTIAKKYVDTLISRKFDRNIEDDMDMNEFSINNVKYPIYPYDVTNKVYVQICMQKDDITVEKLLKIGTIIEDLLDKHRSEISINKYREHFTSRVSYIRMMDTKYQENFDDYTDENVTELLKSCELYLDLKVLLVLIIEDLPSVIFLKLKSDLIKDSLVSSTDHKGLRKRYRRFINKCSKDSRMDNRHELLVQKNLLLVDMGFIYFIESLLKTLLDVEVV